MRWTTLRTESEDCSMQAMLVFAAMNLKKLANWTGKVLTQFDRNNRIKWTKTGRIFKIRLFVKVGSRPERLF